MNDEKHFCQINKNGFALAAGGVMGAIYILCAVFVALWPGFALQLFGWLAHLANVEKFAGDVAITLGGFIWGLIQAVVYTYIGAWFVAWLHNKFCGENKTR
ncbi:hypothetical protein KJ678_03315 [Patescibacteria group bacterium]|nr:hypothetical protein [Patescibacteria group bacterium]